MPIYNYICKCGRDWEEFFTSIKKGQEKAKCGDCGRMAKRVPALGSFKLKGKWFKEGY